MIDKATGLATDVSQILEDVPIGDTALAGADFAGWAVDAFEEGEYLLAANDALGAVTAAGLLVAGIPTGGIDELVEGDVLEGAGEVAGSVLGMATGSLLGGVAGGYAGQALGSAVDEAADATSTATDALVEGASEAVDAVGEAAEDVGDAVGDAVGEVGDFLGF